MRAPRADDIREEIVGLIYGKAMIKDPDHPHEAAVAMVSLLGANDAANVFGTAGWRAHAALWYGRGPAAVFVMAGAVISDRAGIETLQGLTRYSLENAMVASVAAVLTVTLMTPPEVAGVRHPRLDRRRLGHRTGQRGQHRQGQNPGSHRAGLALYPPGGLSSGPGHSLCHPPALYSLIGKPLHGNTATGAPAAWGLQGPGENTHVEQREPLSDSLF